VRKPDRRFMMSALERLGVRADDALVVGDGVPDIEGAKAAGIRCVAVLSGYGDPGELVALAPDLEVDSIQDLAHQLGVRT
jgi:phosphoglycolate phosphatase-like HAD superfamily hydrolase